MYLSAHIKVLINNVRLNSIISVEITNDGGAIGASCEITIPINARLDYKNNPDNEQDSTTDYLLVPARTLFNTGDHIVIYAKYDGYEKITQADSDGYVKLFEGFLYDFYQTTPLKIKCLDYIYWFNLGVYGDKQASMPLGKPKAVTNATGAAWEKISFKEVVDDLILTVNNTIQVSNKENGTSYPLITLYDSFFDMNLVDISFSMMSPAAVLEYFKKEVGFNIALYDNKLYVNIASNTLGTIILNTKKNVLTASLQSTNLQKTKKKGSNSIFLRIKVKAWFIREDGTKDSFEVGDKNGQLREVFFYKVAKGKQVTKDGQQVYENYYSMATEALQKFHQARYTGEVETLLYPIPELFYKVNFSSYRYPEQDGVYVITSKKTMLNENGYHHKLKLALLNDLNSASS